jgi:hypothetical protein
MTALRVGQVMMWNGSLWVNAALSDIIGMFSVSEFGATGDGTTNENAALTAALAAANSDGAELYWPPGNYLTTSSIPLLHTVKHRGPGIILRDGNEFPVEPRTGDTNALYCDASAADDAGDGLSANDPIQQIRTAVDHLANYGPMLEGSWTITAAAGTYKGGVTVPRNLQSRDYITIQGPDVGGHPNVPTAIVSKSADTAQTNGIAATDHVMLWLEDLKVTGAFSRALNMQRHILLQYVNVHLDGTGGGSVGLNIVTHSTYFVTGGIIENFSNGILELFHVTRAFDTVAASADQLLVRDCEVGLKAKEHCNGHLDYANFHDNDTGVELQAWSTTNPKLAEFERNGVGFVLVNSELHNEDSVVFGTGADANGVTVLSLGNSSELSTFGWGGPGGDPAIRTGHRPLVTIYHDYDGVTHTGTTDETDLITPGAIMQDGVFATEGKAYRVVIEGETDNELVGTARILLRTSNIFMTDVTVPAGTASNAKWHAEFDVVCTDDGAFQRASSRLLCDGQLPNVESAARTVDMSSDHSIKISATLADASDSITILSVEVWG